MTANDVRQGRDGDCWFMSSICTLSNKEDLLEKVCVARDEKVGVYGFVFHRGMLRIRKDETRPLLTRSKMASGYLRLLMTNSTWPKKIFTSLSGNDLTG